MPRQRLTSTISRKHFNKSVAAQCLCVDSREKIASRNTLALVSGARFVYTTRKLATYPAANFDLTSIYHRRIRLTYVLCSSPVSDLADSSISHLGDTSNDLLTIDARLLGIILMEHSTMLLYVQYRTIEDYADIRLKLQRQS